jgi:hypothetical protein
LDLSLAGLMATSQGIILGGSIQLCNAIDLVVGF